MISVIIPALNESQAELNATVRSIRENADEKVEIIVVDDCGSTPIPEGEYLVRHLKHRVGGGAARHIGALHAQGDTLVFTDSHCRFGPDWNHHCQPRLPKQLVCGQMLALDHTTGNINQHKGAYFGGKMCIKEPGEVDNRRIIAAKWRGRPKPIGPGSSIPRNWEISACMGACYAIKREFFFQIGGMALLNGFGSEEEFLSMKTMLAGGEIILSSPFMVGHRFRPPGSKLPYRLEMWEKYFNTFVTAYVCCPGKVADELVASIPLNVDVQHAKNHIKQHWHVIEAEHVRLYTQVFKYSFETYLDLLKSIDG